MGKVVELEPLKAEERSDGDRRRKYEVGISRMTVTELIVCPSSDNDVITHTHFGK